MFSEDCPVVSIAGACMAPALSAGRRLPVVAARRYWPGDVLVFLGHDGGLYAHRLIGLYRRCGRWRYLTQADNAVRPDASLTRERILGRLAGGVGLRWRVRAMARFIGFCWRRVPVLVFRTIT